MKNKLRKIITVTAGISIRLLRKIRVGRFFLDELSSNLMQSTYNVDYQGNFFRFAVPNSINYFRASTFSTKEPETLEWIDSIPLGSLFWDIGANVGIYSIYAAKVRECTVYAFEPSVFNLEILARNIHLNELVEQVTIVPLPLSNRLQKSTLNMSTTDWGGALSTFGEDYGHDGKALDKVFEFSTIGLSMVDAIERLNVPVPKYIKIDVDGIEQLILKGGEGILNAVHGVLVEVNDDFSEQREKVSQILLDAGLVLKEKRHSEMFERSAVFGNMYNQIWRRE